MKKHKRKDRKIKCIGNKRERERERERENKKNQKIKKITKNWCVSVFGCDCWVDFVFKKSDTSQRSLRDRKEWGKQKREKEIRKKIKEIVSRRTRISQREKERKNKLGELGNGILKEF